MELKMFQLIAGIQSGIDTARTGGGLTAGSWTIDTVLETILRILTLIVGGLAVAFIVVGGIKYVTSGGDEKKVAGAKNTILYAVIGLVVAIAARVIIGLVLNALNLSGQSGVRG
ncbi:pilin [Candidatus Saccharibacteria bacterium]|nr:pilin [Candidatus Saccharibacteria bacterium]